MNFVQVTQVACPHLVADSKMACKKRSDALRSFLKKFESPTIIYSARVPIYVEREPFDNQEISEDNDSQITQRMRLRAFFPDDLTNALVETLNSWLDDGYGLVIVYPVPEQGFDVPQRLNSISPPISGPEQLPTLSTSYDEYKKRVARSYMALDKVTGSRVKRVYPEKIFCRQESGRCIASESDRLYFDSDNHVGALGADLIVREVATELKLEVPESFRK